MYRECWNKFLFSSFFFFSPGQSTGIWLLLLAIFIYLYLIILYIWFLASLHLAKILGGIFGSGITFFLPLLSLLDIVAYRYQQCSQQARRGQAGPLWKWPRPV